MARHAGRTRQVRRFNIIGATTWHRGRVSRFYVEEGQRLVGCDLLVGDRRGEVTAFGTATAELPSHG